MTQYVFISLCVIWITVLSAHSLECGPNEYAVKCPSSCLQHCPKDANSDRSCQMTKNCEQPACQCIFNYRRARNGTCMPTTSCPPFDCPGQHEKYVACPSYCPTDDCSQATPDGRCPLFGVFLTVVECQPACRCIKGYWRKIGICVPYDQCSGNEQEH